MPDNNHNNQIPQGYKLVQVSQVHAFPALCAFICPGLGHLVKGDLIRAMFIVLMFWLCLLGGVTAIVSFFIWIWQIQDAYNGQ